MWPAKGEGAPGGVLLPLGVGLPPPFLVGLGLEGEGVEEKEGTGAPPPSPCPIRTRGEGRAASPCLLSSLPPRPTKSHLIHGGFW